MTSAIDGLISGLDTTTIITSLMTLEAQSQTGLKAKVTTTNAYVTALQSLNVKLSSLATSAKTAATPASWEAAIAKSSAASVTATTTAGAKASSLTFSVDAVAKAQTSVSAVATDFAASYGGTLSLSVGTTADPTVTSIDLTDVTDLAGVAKAINSADTGVTATVVKISATESRLQLTSATTGLESGFDLYAGAVTAAEVTAGTATAAELMGRSAGTLITGAADAKITLWSGTGAETEVTSASNTFTGVLTGVDFTVSAVASDVTLTVGGDDAALTSLASGLVSNLTTVLSEIVSQTTNTTTTTDGATTTKFGVLSKDSDIRAMKQAVLSAASNPINGISPSSIGIVLGKDGSMSFDATKFAAALAADPDGVQAVVTGVAARLQTVAEGFSNSSTGSVTNKITSQKGYVDDLGDQILSWDTRLTLRRTALEKQYAALEVALGKLGSQSDWLTSQLETLSSNSS
ncbi:flagellar filament capping protein FliD [Pengzhenrongella sicca]|uniref:Flagellar hook-associated protein 2 n=1 Tax=Pengzhenrongella sicca TaxID=2819238 RepID=A0A8A4ZH52_9MICO|nr:flagellar filament capping protein FliD [Pengzhenrongella sicca]QTE29856.1 flagellar filament capping protein FliD [Pengzhenrongella sicca]